MTPTLLVAVIGQHASRMTVTNDFGFEESETLQDIDRVSFFASFIEVVRVEEHLGRQYGAFSGSTWRGAWIGRTLQRTMNGCRPLPLRFAT